MKYFRPLIFALLLLATPVLGQVDTPTVTPTATPTATPTNTRVAPPSPLCGAAGGNTAVTGVRTQTLEGITDADTHLLYESASGRVFVHTITVSSAGAETVTLKDDTSARALGAPFVFAAAGSQFRDYGTFPLCSEGSVVVVTTGTSATTVTVQYHY